MNNNSREKIEELFHVGGGRGYNYKCRNCTFTCKTVKEAREHACNGISVNGASQEDTIIHLDPEKWVKWASDLLIERDLYKEELDTAQNTIKMNEDIIKDLNGKLINLERTQREVKVHNEQAQAYVEYNKR